ncbi:MAG: PASTA domain-containing protein, partial [Clostridiales Family XIII bacterium]|nr:PASTA domain-containing protein [Clostridiales Family XIII bacterium]
KEGAEAAINSSGFRPGNVAYSASDAPSGQVVAQSPKSGEMLEKGKAISYTVSTGPATKTVPTVAGQSSEAAQAAIAAAGFLLGNIAEEYSDIYEAGLVTRTDPAAGTEQKEGTAISIFVSKGKGITVQGLVGETLRKSEIKARLSGLKVSFVEVPIYEVENDSIAIGTVLDQSIAAGEVVAEGTEITVTLVVEDVDDDEPEEIEV